MIQSFKIVNYLGESLFLDIRRPEDTGLLVASVTGLNYPKTDIAAQNYATYDGAKFGNLHIGTRNIVMSIIFYENNKERLDVESLRWRLQRYFLPKTELTFYATNEHGTFWIKGIVESNEINIFSKQEASQISILCADPYFNKDENDRVITIGVVDPLFEFPFSIEMNGSDVLPPYTKTVNAAGGYTIEAPDVYYEVTLNSETLDLGFHAKAIRGLNTGKIEFGKIKNYPRTIIDYDGSAVTGLTINIEAKGPIRNLRINNVTRNEYIVIDDSKLYQILGSTYIQKYDQIIIDTRKGQKSAKLIRDAKTYNILNACLPVSKWVQLQTGPNEFTYSTSNEIENVDMNVTFPVRYLAI